MISVNCVPHDAYSTIAIQAVMMFVCLYVNILIEVLVTIPARTQWNSFHPHP